MQNQSEALLGQYKQNLNDLNDIQGQQNLVIDELAAIENELDNLLPQGSEAAMFRSALDEPDVPLREQVQKQAIQIDGEVETLNFKLMNVQKEIDERSFKTNKAMGLNALSANQDYHNSLDAVEDISKILGNYYDTLKWIQGSAVDLQF